MAIHDLLGIIGNFLWFFYEFFSIPLLLKTLFVPFHRLQETAQKGFKPSAWAEAFIVTTLMRLVGAFLRILLITIGIFFMILTIVVGTGVMLTWIAAPLMLLFLLISGVTLIGIG
jgi:hypothetical protein